MAQDDSTYISRSEWDRVFSRLTVVPGLPPKGLCGTSGTQKSWVIIGPMLRAKPIPRV
uniref:Uncharacterized protein n=1 Tax=Setaria italica TaxID=4555 RepID=K3Z2I4_SETIT